MTRNGGRGYMFSVLIAMLLAYFMITVGYYVMERPSADVYLEMEQSRGIAAGHVAKEVAGDFPAASGKATRMEVTEARDATTLAGLDTTLARWAVFLATNYSNYTQHNVGLDADGSGNLTAGRLELVARDAYYKWDGAVFSLNHSGSYLLANITVASVANTDCPLGAAGEVVVRVIVNNFDSGDKNITRGTAYSCFINFSAAQNMTISFDTNADMRIDYANAPTTLTQRVTFDTNASALQAVFSRENVTTNVVNPGWALNLTGAKRNGTSANGNFILLDGDSNGVYDYMFVDADKNGNFSDAGDVWHAREGVVALDGKGFYTWFDLGGNWIMLHKALAVRSGGSWRGVAV